MREYRRILALVDLDQGLAPARTTVRRALGLARLSGASLALLHVVPPDTALDGGWPAPSLAQQANACEQAALRRLRFFAATLEVPEPDLLTGYGERAAVFARRVADWRPDLVVCSEDPGFLDGAHDLLILGQTRRGDGAGIGRRFAGWLAGWFSPVRG